MQKALLEMNLQLDHVVSDTPARPACGLSESLSHQSRRAGTYWDVRCHSSIETIRAALVSNDPIAGALRRLSGKMLYCDRKLELLISALNAKGAGPVRKLVKPRVKTKPVNTPISTSGLRCTACSASI